MYPLSLLPIKCYELVIAFFLQCGVDVMLSEQFFFLNTWFFIVDDVKFVALRKSAMGGGELI
jgi:hypothetical protein